MSNNFYKSQQITAYLHYLFKLVPVLISGMCIYLGYKLFVLGVTGEASLVVESKELSAQLINAAPGLFFTIGGIAGIRRQLPWPVGVN
jgi:hypothetical protein